MGQWPGRMGELVPARSRAGFADDLGGKGEPDNGNWVDAG